jgi:hypothetical protein
MKLIKTEMVAVASLRVWTKAAELFPRYTAAQYQELNAYHAKHGDDAVLPIVINAQFQIVDGYNRVEAARQAGAMNILAHRYEYASEAEQEIHAIVLNAKRRHLDEATTARVALRLAKLYEPTEEQLRARNRKGGKTGGKNHPKNSASTHGYVQADSGDADSATGGERKDGTTERGTEHKTDGAGTGTGRGEAGKGKRKRSESATEKAAREVGVAPKTMRSVAKVDASGDAALIGAMNSRLVGIDKAARIADLPPEQREVALRVIREELQSSIDGPRALAKALTKENADHGIAACLDAGQVLGKGMGRVNLPKLEKEHMWTLRKALLALGMQVKGYLVQLEGAMDQVDAVSVGVDAAELDVDPVPGHMARPPADVLGTGSVCRCGHQARKHDGQGRCTKCDCRRYELTTETIEERE